MYKCIYDIKSDIEKLEYDLMEEQFHYNSIPVRKEKTKSELRYRSIFVILISAIELFLIGNIIGTASPVPDGAVPPISVAIFTVVFPILAIALGILDVILIKGWLQEMGLLYGWQKKNLNFGASNYEEERKISENRIKYLIEDIEGLKKQLKDFRESESYEKRQERLADEEKRNYEQSKTMEEMSDNEFYAFAYGKWGEEKESIDFKFSIGKYQIEKEDLTKEIEQLKQSLIQIAMKKSRVETEYKNAKQTLTSYALILFGFIIFEFIFDESIILRIVIGVLGLIIAIILGINFKKKYSDTFLYYDLDHNYSRIKSYAEDHRLKTTNQQKDDVLFEIKNKQNRLEFVEHILLRKTKDVSVTK